MLLEILAVDITIFGNMMCGVFSSKVLGLGVTVRMKGKSTCALTTFFFPPCTLCRYAKSLPPGFG